MKNVFRLLILFLSLIVSISNAAPKKKKYTKKKKSIKKEVIAPMPTANTGRPILFCMSQDEWPAWYLTSIVGFTFPKNAVNPANYRLLHVDEPAMIQYLQKVPYEASTIKVTVPLFIDNTLLCKEFTIERVRTMDDELQAKYPELMSFKVYEPSNQLNAGRVDCDAISTKFMITYNTKVYYLTPIDYNGGKVYAAYSKDDPNFQKKEFEKKR